MTRAAASADRWTQGLRHRCVTAHAEVARHVAALDDHCEPGAGGSGVRHDR